MTFSVAIAGASGYAGGEFARLVLSHPDLELGALTAHSNAGEPVAASQPHLAAHPAIAGRTFAPTDVEQLLGHDVVALALPHGASGAIAAQLEQASPETLIVDLGADHRLASAADWEAFYGGEHPGTWTYGMPELVHAGELGRASAQRDLLAETKRIAVPGCNVTAVTLGIQAGVHTGLIDPAAITATLAVGYSGAGKAAKPHLLASEGLGNATAYAVGGVHRHVPEIRQNLTTAGASDPQVVFTPVLVPTSRGIHATITAPLVGDVDAETVRECWAERYEEEAFIHLLAPGTQPATAATTGANTALLQVTLDAARREVIVTCALDNLVKGTAGAAVQSINLALGLPETLGLPVTGVAP
ncbi:N-acetyl-gamma-glutamyl-phosphate reductase [Serinibacter salmoneus]|nr:N-acetyl-gamma-glutamyl-phosphate reductase [Serinibacter salmoneus]